MEEITQVDVSYQPIELCKLLKIANMVGGGGEAKIVISEGYVYVNGEVEFQKRKKIYHQDIVEFNGEAIAVSCSEPVLNATEQKALKAAKVLKAEESLKRNKKAQKTSIKSKPKQNKKTVNNHNNEVIQQPVPSGQRKRISF
ncbi:MAG: RNA-binding S4 domain-containing protein [Thalassotalea sp.]|nr:RNA-binding S4 domain-containing protein [Thalassotalea sp.]